MAVIETKLFKNAGGMAVQLPDDFGSDSHLHISADRSGNRVTITAVKRGDPATEKRRLTDLIARMKELGPVGEIEVRDPDIFPDRPGLY